MANNTKINFNTARRPGTAHGYIPKFHHMIVIDKVIAIGFINSSPNFPANFRKMKSRI